MEILELEALLKGHSEWVDDFLHDLYDEIEDDDLGREKLRRLDQMADELGLVEAHPIHQDIRSEDFEFESLEDQIQFFKECQNSVFFQNLPDLNLNSLQVSCLHHVLEKLSKTLVDDGGPESFLLSGDSFKKYLNEEFSAIETKDEFKEKKQKRASVQVLMDDPLSLRLRFLKKIFEEKEIEKIEMIVSPLLQDSKELDSIFRVLAAGEFNSQDLIVKTKMNPKNLSDGVEKLSNFLKKEV
jgi:hypothetical protein